MFKRKKKKTGCETPEYMKTTAPAQLNVPPMPKVKSSAPNPNFGYQPISQSSERPKPPNTGSKVQKSCSYRTPCSWCTKWDKKCDRKIGCGKDKDLQHIKAGHGLAYSDVSKLFKEPWRSDVP